MSDYCHRKAVRFKIDEELACKLLVVEQVDTDDDGKVYNFLWRQ